MRSWSKQNLCYGPLSKLVSIERNIKSKLTFKSDALDAHCKARSKFFWSKANLIALICLWAFLRYCTETTPSLSKTPWLSSCTSVLSPSNAVQSDSQICCIDFLAISDPMKQNPFTNSHANTSSSKKPSVLLIRTLLSIWWHPNCELNKEWCQWNQCLLKLITSSTFREC